MSDSIIKVEDLGKKYIISHEGTKGGYTALRDIISNKANSFLKKFNGVPSKEEFWALKDVSFEIKKGEAVGIIGRNGAGKSTLLKILSRITEPTTGRIEINGRVASLLEVGTGFHPELTGRENIFLNGAILGMSRAEIRSKFDEIVDFSGVEKFLDTPVKRFSSGMYVRLAFAVAAHLEPEILVIDEVLAVGDAQFQRKCLGKMEEVSKSGGRTILFVSHQLEAIKQLCTSAILFRNGKLTKADNTEDVISEYLNSGKDELKSQNFNSEKEIYISGFQVKPLMEKHLYPGFSYEFEIQVLNRSSQEEKLHIGIGVNDKFGARLFTLYSRFNDEAFTIERGINVIKCELDKLILKPDIYNVHIYLGNGFETTDYIPGSLSFEVEPYPFFSKMMPDSSHGPMLLQHKWRINE